MNLPIISALIASFSYALFSKFYEPAVRKVGISSSSAIILYFLSALILLFLSVVTGILSGESIKEHSKVIFFGINLTEYNSPYFFIAAVFVMANLYALHIQTEAISRRSMNIGIYSVVFQLSFVVLAISDIFLFQAAISSLNIIGCFIVLGVSSCGLIVHSNRVVAQKAREIKVEIILPALLSALTCGLALLIDAEIIRNFVFHASKTIISIPTFLLYEAITFLFPATIVFGFCFVKNPNKKLIAHLWSDFHSVPLNFLLASFFSASQFVFSVLSLSLPGPRLIPSVILGTSPFICILLDDKLSFKTFLIDLFLALAIIIGVVLSMS